MGQSAQDPLPCAAEVPATFSQLGRPSLGEGLRGLLWEPSVQEVSLPARAVVVFLGHLSSLLGAYSDERGGARISAPRWWLADSLCCSGCMGRGLCNPFLPVVPKPLPLCGHNC